ncbi:WRKY42 [Artemisia annua]|uniref:WRKY42 n=1 Tax=Artemisia annua TaxID=35608 RepID=A0A2U1KQQ8_ARTAN|nr:WRKY42 [Artemisia annua]
MDLFTTKSNSLVVKKEDFDDSDLDVNTGSDLLTHVSSDRSSTGYDRDHVNNIENWKLENLVKNLKAARGIGNGILSLLINPNDDLSRVNELFNELEKVTDPLEKDVLHTVFEAFWSYQMVPKPNNGLAIFAGGVFEDDGEIKP